MSQNRSISPYLPLAAVAPTVAAVVALVFTEGPVAITIAAVAVSILGAVGVMYGRATRNRPNLLAEPAQLARVIATGDDFEPVVGTEDEALDQLIEDLDTIDQQRHALVAYANAAMADPSNEPALPNLDATPLAPVIRMLDERTRREGNKLTDARRLLYGTMETSSEAIAIVDPSGNVLRANPKAERAVGGLGNNMSACLPAWRDLNNIASRMERVLPNGRAVTTEMAATAIETQYGQLHVVCWRDIDKAVAAHAEPTNIDETTGLLNRNGVIAAYEEACKFDEAVAAIHIDLDGFQTINHHHGYDQGDAILREVGQRLLHVIPNGAAVGRTSGDEFIAFFRVADADPERIVQRVLRRCSEPVPLFSGGRTSINVRAGWAMGVPDMSRDNQILRRATFALYEAKSGATRVERFDAELARRVDEQRQVELDLRTALNSNEFVLYGQQIVDVLEQRVDGVEMLLRWQHPVKGVRSPAEFLDAAERGGLVEDIDRWVFAQTCEQAKASDPQLSFSMNLSSSFISRPDAAQFIISSIAESGLASGRVQVDLKEASRSIDVEALVRTTNKLAERGVHVAIDDFGSGYSTLTNLLHMTISSIKIDRAIVSLVGEPEGRGVVQAILAYAKQRNIRVVAEGVETAEESHLLRELGCRYQQGYFHHRPEPVDQLLAAMPKTTRAQTLVAAY